VRIERINHALYRITTPYDKTGTVFLYLLKGDRVALVDTGAVDSPREVLEPALAEIGMGLSDVDLILNTHAHLDHSGGNLETKRASGAPIHVHALDLMMAQSTEAQVESHIAPLRQLELPDEFIQERADFVIRNAGPAVGADVVLTDGEIVDLGAGVQLRVIHCPGHTPGHVCYFWEREGLLISGDAIQGQGARPGGYPYYFNARDYRRSLTALAKLDIRTLCTGHAFLGGTLVNSPTRSGTGVAMLLQESMRVADSIHKAVTEAIHHKPGAGKRDLAFAALSELIYHIPQLLVRQTGMPLQAGPTLVAHIDAALEGSYP
jgi:glyoxylase-like metal-dependent hydrolase (beta-lactamase superfamily II)